MAYDVGMLTREIQSAFRLFSAAPDDREGVLALQLQDAGGTATNLATPENLRVLVDTLAEVTADLMLARRDLSTGAVALQVGKAVLLGPAFWTPEQANEALAQWDLDLVRWQGRLGAYADAVDAAPPGDRAAVLWDVTAPLLLGFYGGQASKLPRQTLDAVTPFMLANQLAVDEAWREERLQLLLDDLKTGLKDVITVGAGIGVAALIGLGLLFLIVTRGRK